MNKVLVSLGSNIYSKLNIDRAKRMLAHYFPDVVFTEQLLSISSDEKYVFPFRNVLGVFNSEWKPEEITDKLKHIESVMGRKSRDKELGRVVIDLDLVQYGDEILRPEDYEREYVQSLLKTIEL